ncbi:hypothetical protein CN918_32605 [Priestia megaterium]|nr:hypothetical protein CN918_32605 [Priestia megaterium]
MYDMYLELYLGYLENNNLSQRTLNDYKKELTKFTQYLETKGVQEVEAIKTLHIDMYTTEWLKKKNVSTTRAKKVTILKRFFHFLYTREYIQKNPMMAIDNIKIKDVDKKEKFVLTRKESEKLIRTVTKHTRNKEKSRSLIFIMLKCGLRVNEVCELKVKNIDFNKKTIRVDGKGGKTRYVPLFEEMIGDLKTYLKNRKTNSEFLFTSKDSEKQLTPRAVHDFVKTYIHKAKIDKVIGCHALRRTAATQLLKEGARITSIQKFLGHSTVATTEMYLQESESEIQNEIRSKTRNIVAKNK